MSKNTLSKLFIFVAGAAVGSAVTWKLVETKYNKIAQEEIDSVRAVYEASKNDVNSDSKDESGEDDEEDDVEDLGSYHEYVSGLGYTENSKKEDDDVGEPYVISPEEYDEIGYETVSLYYYEDGVLENAITKEVIKNSRYLVGEDFMNHFGEYEPDSVYIRNDDIETDFEILKDGGYYSEVE